MKLKFTVLALLLTYFFCSNILAQVSGTIISGADNVAVPFANIWIKGKYIGTTSDINGKFVLKSASATDTLVFSAIGYAVKYSKVFEINKNNIVKLQTKDVVLQEVIIKPRTVGENRYSIGEFNSNVGDMFYQNYDFPLIIARKYEYSEEYTKTPFIKSIKFLLNSNIKNARINVRIYSINEFGEPGDFILNKNLFAKVAEGKKVATIDVSRFDLVFPKSGLFVAIETLMIPENAFEHEIRELDPLKTTTKIGYEPSIGLFCTESCENSYYYAGGTWHQATRHNNLDGWFKDYHGKFALLMCEVVLSD